MWIVVVINNFVLLDFVQPSPGSLSPAHSASHMFVCICFLLSVLSAHTHICSGFILLAYCDSPKV